MGRGGGFRCCHIQGIKLVFEEGQGAEMSDSFSAFTEIAYVEIGRAGTCRFSLGRSSGTDVKPRNARAGEETLSALSYIALRADIAPIRGPREKTPIIKNLSPRRRNHEQPVRMCCSHFPGASPRNIALSISSLKEGRAPLLPGSACWVVTTEGATRPGPDIGGNTQVRGPATRGAPSRSSPIWRRAGAAFPFRVIVEMRLGLLVVP